MFEGEALLRRMYRYGFLDESQTKLDYVLALTPQDVLERRLQVRWLWRWQWGWWGGLKRRHWQDTLDAPAVAEGL
jgi:hypothetical protein